MRIAGGTAKRITKRIINFILVMSVSDFAFPGVGLVYPGICLIVCCAGFNLLGEGLRVCSFCLI
jgi:ABC transporter, permease protein